ncbi:MAG: pseudouridine synthase [Saprospiraceae bacterium]
MFQYFAVYKPYQYLSQFSKEKNTDLTLADLFDFPKDVYPVGRLDKDSEGLLFLTNDPSINDSLLNPKNNKVKKYLVQLDGEINPIAIGKLEQGVEINVDGKKYKTLASKVKLISDLIHLPDRNPPIRIRKNIPTTWIELSINEGKNRQVRKMCSAVGFPVLRLIRTAIGKYSLAPLENLAVIKITKNEMLAL